MTRLEAHGLGYAVAGRTILEDVSLRTESGRFFGIVGPSGAGKSSLLGLLSGLLTPTDGSVAIDGEVVSTRNTQLRRRIGLVLQGYGLVAALTGRENVAVALRARGRGGRDADALATDALASVGLADVADHLIDDLSGGQQQRVAVARGIAGDPEFIIADEPTAELDAENRHLVLDLLAAAARRGAVVVVAAHDPELAERCDDVLHLEPHS